MGKKPAYFHSQLYAVIVIVFVAIVGVFFINYLIGTSTTPQKLLATTIPSDACINPVDKCTQGIFSRDVCQFIPDGTGKTAWNYFTISGNPRMSVQQYGNSGGEPNHIHLESADGKPFVAGVYYTFPTVPGHRYCASWRWGPNTHDQAKVGVETFVKTIGLDSQGGNNPLASSVSWGNSISKVARHNDYPPPDVNLDHKLVATGNSMTLFLKAEYKALENSYMQIDMVNVYDEGTTSNTTPSPTIGTNQNNGATPFSLKFNNNPSRDSTNVMVGVEIADINNVLEVQEVISQFGGTPIFIKIKHPTSATLNSPQFDALKNAGFSFYISQSDYASLNTFAAAYYQKYPTSQGVLILELDRAGALNASQTQLLSTAFPGAQFVAADFGAGDYTGIQNALGVVSFPALKAISYNYPNSSNSDVYGSDFFTANETLFDTSVSNFMVKWPADSNPTENMMTALSHIDTPNMASHDNEARRFGIAAIAFFDYAQLNGQHGIKYINLGTFASFQPPAKKLARYIAELSKRNMRIFWPNTSTGNGDPWQNNGVLDPSTKPVVGIAADSGTDGVAYFLVNGGSQPQAITLVYPPGFAPSTFSRASTIRAEQTGVSLTANRVDLDPYESTLLFSNPLSGSPQPTIAPQQSPTPQTGQSGDNVSATLEKINPPLPQSCNDQGGTINFVNHPFDIKYTITNKIGQPLEKARIYIGKADFSPWTTCPAGTSIKSPTIIGQPTTSMQWCVINDIDLTGKPASTGVISYTPDQIGDFYIVINAKEPNVARSCSGNPQGIFNGGTIPLDANHEWYDCGPNDSFLLKVRSPDIACTIPTPTSTQSSTQSPVSSLEIATQGPFCTQNALKLRRIARASTTETLASSDLLVSVLDAAEKPSVWTCPTGTTSVGAEGKWCLINSSTQAGQPSLDTSIDWTPPAPGSYVVMVNAKNANNQMQCSGNPDCISNGGALDCKSLSPSWQDCGPNDFIKIRVDAQCGSPQTTYGKFTIESDNGLSCTTPGSRLDFTIQGTADAGHPLEKAEVYVGKKDLSPWDHCPVNTVASTPNNIWCKVSELAMNGLSSTVTTSFTPDQAGEFTIVVNGKEKNNANQCTGNTQCVFNGGTIDCPGWYDCSQNSTNPHDSIALSIPLNQSNCPTSAPGQQFTSNSCTSLVSHGDKIDKHDIIVIPDGYTDPNQLRADVDKALEGIKTANLGGLFNKLNFWLASDLSQQYGTSQGCARKFEDCHWDLDKTYKTMRACEGDSVLLISNIDRPPDANNSGMAIIGGQAALIYHFAPFTAVHELAHSIASANDEYDFNKKHEDNYPLEYNCSDRGASSTSAPCPKWASDGLNVAQCISVCGFSDWFRSSQKSIMTYTEDILSDHYFNAPTLKMWEYALKNFK